MLSVGLFSLYSYNFLMTKIIASDNNEVMMIPYWAYCDSICEIYHNFMTEIKNKSKWRKKYNQARS